MFKPPAGWKHAAQALVALVGTWLVPAMLCAQAANDAPTWQAMRIYVPEDQVGSVVPRDYLTTDIDDLEKLLAEEARRRAQSAVQAMGIQRAIYVTRWTDQLLSSSASMWQVALPGNSQPLNIGPTSVAIDDPLFAPSGSEPLTRYLRYVDDTRLQLLAPGDEQTVWFGFKTKTRGGESGQQSVDLVLPRAAFATLLIAVPANSTVKATLPCARIDAPSQYLPNDWPAASISGSGEQWYIVHLSGSENCSLSLTPAAKANQFPYKMSVATAQCDLIAQPSGLEANCRFQLAKRPLSNAVRIRVEEPLHVRSVQVNGMKTTRWKTVVEDEETISAPGPRLEASAGPVQMRSRLIDVPLDAPGDGPLLVTVEAISRLPLPYAGALPRVEVADAYILDGHGSLTSAENVQIEDVESSIQQLTSSSAAGYASWQWHWTGKTPTIHTRVRANTNQWTLRTLTRFNIQTNAIVATAHVQLSSQSVQANQVALKLGNGWLIDSVELNHAPLGVSAGVRDSAGGGSDLSVRWDERRDDLDVHLTVNAHYPQRTEVDTLRLQSTRIVTLPGADQVDTYAIAPSNRFQLEIDPELLRLRIDEADLLAWQKELLPKLDEEWFFQSTRNNLPPIRLRRTRATLEADLQTVVTERPQETVITYRVRCQPDSGSIDQIRLMLPIPADVVAPTWSLVSEENDSNPSGLLLSSRATSSSAGETSFTIELSHDMAEPFVMEAELRLQRGAKMDAIPLPSVPQAVSQEAIVVVPASLALPEGVQGLEILPRGACCTDSDLINDADFNAGRVVAARYDPNVVSHVRVQRDSQSPHGAWVQRELHEHWHHSGGRFRHRTAWHIANPSPHVMQFILPTDWHFETLKLDGQLVEAIEQVDGRVRVQLPEAASLRVELECTSQGPSGWIGRVDMVEPDSGLPVLATRRVVWFPGTVVADQSWPSLSSATWTDRLMPSIWWSWLSIDPWQELLTQPTRDSSQELSLDSHPVLASLSDEPPLRGNWWPLELEVRQVPSVIWYAERSLVGAMLLALTIIVGVFVYSVCDWRLPRWWVACSVAAALLCIVPALFLPVAQLFALSVAVAALVRISLAIMTRSRPAPKPRDFYPSSMASASRALPPLLVALALAGPLAGRTAGQPLTEADTQDREEIFGILIPVDSDFQIAGDYVYVPTRLSRLLSNSSPQNATHQSVAVQAAFYSLRISNDPISLASSVGELTVELTVQSTQADSELRLQFSNRELQLQRAFLDSQEIFQSQRLKHEADVLSWRASDADRHTLRLVFRPREIAEKDGRGVLSIGIPAIPTAKLEIMGDDLRDVTVDAIGRTLLESPRFLTAELGPTNRLALTWPLVVNRSASVQIQSDTWIHTRGDQIMAQCQLRVRGAAALPSVLHIVGDSNWQPVGQDWEDCRLLSVEGASATGRPVYSVQRISDSAADTLSIRVLLLARGEVLPPTLSIPFLALQEAAPQLRTLAISHAEAPTWKPVGTETWQPLLASQAATIWDKARLSDQPTISRVPAGTVIATLQRAPAPPAAQADETTEISLQFPDIKMQYAARWSQPLPGKSTIRFHVPSALRVDAAYVDTLPVRHTTHRLPTGSGPAISEVIVFVDGSHGDIKSVNLQLSMPTRLTRTLRLPRPLLVGTKIGSSVLQIYRGAELSSELKILDDADIQLDKFEVRPGPLLSNLHTLIGQVDLQGSFRDSVELPIEVRLSRTAGDRNGRALVQMMRSDQGWTAHINAIVDVPQGEVNHVFFDLPSSLAASFLEPVDSNVPMMLWPSADTDRAIVCVLPPLAANGKSHINLTIRLPATGASQSITIPDIRLLGMSVQRPALALPKRISGAEVNWSQVGRPLPENWSANHGFDHLKLNDYVLFEPSGSHFQAVWHSRQTEEQSARVLLTRVQVVANGNDGCSAKIGYWIDPRNQVYLSAKLPAGCQLIGAQLGSRAVTWTETDPENIRILLQPSYLPVQLVLYVRWSGDLQPTSNTESMALLLPELTASHSNDILVALANSETRKRYSLAGGAAALTSPQTERITAQAWADTLLQAAPIAADREPQELTAWLPAWEPKLLGLAGDLKVVVPKQFIASEVDVAGNGGGTTGTISVSEFWDKTIENLRIDPSAWQTASSENLAKEDLQDDGNDSSLADDVQDASRLSGSMSAEHEEHQLAGKWFRISATAVPSQLSLRAVAPPRAPLVLTQIMSAGAVLLLSVVLWSVRWAWLGSWLSVLADLVWPLWLSLAAATWLFLPVAWPSLIVALGGAIVWWRRYRELRRDRQFVLSPRALR